MTGLPLNLYFGGSDEIEAAKQPGFICNILPSTELSEDDQTQWQDKVVFCVNCVINWVINCVTCWKEAPQGHLAQQSCQRGSIMVFSYMY